MLNYYTQYIQKLNAKESLLLNFSPMTTDQITVTTAQRRANITRTTAVMKPRVFPENKTK